MVDPTSNPFDKFAHTDELHLLRTHLIWDRKWYDDLESVDDKNVINVMRKITKKNFDHISQTDNIIILIMSLLKHMLKILPVINMRLSLRSVIYIY